MNNKRFGLLWFLLFILFGIIPTEVWGDSKTPRIGVLIRNADQSDSQTVRGLRAGLRALGYQEDENLIIDVRNTRGVRGTLDKAAMELVGEKVDLIFAMGSSATRAAKKATKKIPIVFRHPLDPVAMGLVKSMGPRQSNVTGVAGLSVQRADTRLEIFKEIVPSLRRIIVFYDLYNPISREHFSIAEVAATNLGLHVLGKPVQSDRELKSSLTRFDKENGDGIYHVSDILVQSQADFIFSMARQKRLPTMFGRSEWANRGSLAGYGPNNEEMGRQAASLIDKILKGAKPGDLAIEPAKKFDLYINLRTAKVIRVSVPREVLRKADKVIR
ncbi:MAG: hypothetical protein GTO40_28245 [Deltaproteobacteria bacterium]|nr:hypothetical protein [Deltaproteobacteria bacterium]